MLPLLTRKARLLLLDDDTSMQKLVSTLLSRAGYKVDVVSSGSQALEKMAKQKYKALLLDVMTPTEGGLTVIRHLRESAPEMLQRVVLLTASPDSVIKAVTGEVFGVVHKPFEAAHLLAVVERVVAQG